MKNLEKVTNVKEIRINMDDTKDLVSKTRIYRWNKGNPIYGILTTDTVEMRNDKED